jgi:hypothetical protein
MAEKPSGSYNYNNPAYEAGNGPIYPPVPAYSIVYPQGNPPYSNPNNPYPSNPYPSYPNPNFYNPNQQPIIVVSRLPPVQPGNSNGLLTPDQEIIATNSKICRWLSIGEIIANIIYSIFTAILIFTAVFFALGYFGCRRLNKALCVIYCIFLVINIISKIIIMAFFPYIYILIIFSILISYEIITLRRYVMFLNLIWNLDVDARNQIVEIIYRNRTTTCFI